MGLVRREGRLLRVDGNLATACCCDDGGRCVRICCSLDTTWAADCQRPGIFTHQITIPSGYSLPVPINISGVVNDDLLLDGQSITTDLALDPGPYPDTSGFGCVGGHDIADKPGPFSDTINGGITFPMSRRTFAVAVRDTVGGGSMLDVTICVDPNGTQAYRGNLRLSGTCDPGTSCNPLP